MIRYFPLLLAACLLLSAAGCASRTDMEALQSERMQDANRLQQLQTELAESKRLLRQEIEKSQNPVREKTADTWAELQTLRADFAKLRGELETLNMRMDRQIGAANATTTLSSLSERIDGIDFILENDLQVDMDKAHQEFATHSGGAPAPAAPAAPAAAETPAPATPAPAAAPSANPDDAAKALYDKAYDLYKQGDFEKARSYWAEFTDTFKQHPYVPSAVFWQGQCYYKLQDYARAVILYEDVIDKYSTSAKYRSALLMAAYSWQKIGKPDLAKMRLDEVVKKFPGTPQAIQAKRELDKMK